MYVGGLCLTAVGCSPSEDPLADEDQILLQSAGLDLPTEPFAYANPDLPNHFLTREVRQADNGDNAPVTDWGATLGRALFYDKSLSQNRTISCASCHQQEAAFSDPLALSIGFEGGETGRNSMGLSNARWYASGHFFWDERAESLEDQVLMPIQDGVEMGLSLDELVERLEAVAGYDVLFEQAFGTPDITTTRISDALSQFVRCIISYQSPYDEGRARVNDSRDPFPNFTQQENLGKALFMGRAGCDRCHETDLFILDQARNIGLDATTTDPGLAGSTGDPDDEGKFKVPSLRNVALTAPFMHDGRFETLAQVINHYDRGVQPHPNLDRRLERNGRPQRLGLSPAERQALVAFLETLTDPELITDEKFSDPFFEQ